MTRALVLMLVRRIRGRPIEPGFPIRGSTPSPGGGAWPLFTHNVIKRLNWFSIEV
jgi:hypothetical protein